MTDYPRIEAALAGYFNMEVGNSEEEAVFLLRQDLATTPLFRDLFTEELKRAFADDSLSWAEMFERHEAAHFEEESEARDYARRMLWEAAFGS
jgi:hypothetical protein